MPQRDLDVDLLRAFVTIASSGGFTRAAERLGRTQAAISLQIRRLEDAIGQPLLIRQGRKVWLSASGEILLPYAQQILTLHDEAHQRFGDATLAGCVRLGTPEDFATVYLPTTLALFARTNPRVVLDVRCDFTVNLLDQFSRGEFDLVLVKQEPHASPRGVRVWQEKLVWVQAPTHRINVSDTLPLVLAPPPDIYRRRALAALEQAGIAWTVVYTSPSLAGIQAAVRAGLGITVLSKDMIPVGLRVASKENRLPDIPDSEIAMLRAQNLSPAAERLAGHIIMSLEGHAGET